jgi:hypothetical protein
MSAVPRPPSQRLKYATARLPVVCPSVASAPARSRARPDMLHFFAHSEWGGSGQRKEWLAARAGEVIFGALANGLFVTQEAEPIECEQRQMSFQSVRSTGLKSVPVVHCHNTRGNSALVSLDPALIDAPEDPWVFASDCAEQLADVFEGSSYFAGGIFRSGNHFMTYPHLIGHIAQEMSWVKRPRTDIELATHVAQLGTAIAWAVTGGCDIPRVEFTVDEHRFRS